MQNLYLYIILREDLKMSVGKSVAQGVHAALRSQLSEIEFPYNSKLYNPIVIVKKVKSEEALINTYNKAGDSGIKVSIQRDLGFNEVDANTPTSIAIGPCLEAECEHIVKRLRNL